MSEIKMKHIAVGKVGHVWAVGAADGTIYGLQLVGMAHWAPDKVGKADVIAVADGGDLWVVNQEHRIFHGVPVPNLPGSLQWNAVATHSGQPDARAVSVGAVDGSVWYVDNNSGMIFQLENNVWQADPVGRALAIAAVSKHEIWCINSAHEIYHLKGGQWSKVPTFSGRADAQTIAVGIDGSVWYGSTDGGLYFYRLNDAVWVLDLNWQPAQMGSAWVLAVHTQRLVWCLATTGEVWHAFDYQWQKVVETPLNDGNWSYLVTPNDTQGLGQIVMDQYHVEDGPTVNRIIDRIAALSQLADRDRIDVGQTLTMPPLSYR